MRKSLIIPASLILLAMTVGISMAQPGVATCSPLIDDALAQLGDNCDGLSRNSACYGNTLVQAALTEDADEDLFNEPRDRAELVQVSSLRTAPLNEVEQVWGIAMINTQANLPGTLPGQGVVMMLMGDGEITNSVNPADLPTLTPVTGVINETGSDAGVRVRTGAGTNYNVNSVLSPGTEVTVDARTEDSQWLRVVAGENFGWIFADLLTLTDSTPTDLPVLEDQLQAPMQAFYFRSGVGNTDCEAAPNALMIQSPKGGQVALTINQSEIVIGSTVVIETLDDNTMIIYVIDGTAIVNNLIVPEGFKAYAPIEVRDDLIAALQEQNFDVLTISNDGLPAITGPWETCDPISDQDRDWLSTLGNIPEELLNYEIDDAPDATGICASPEEIVQQSQSQPSGGDGNTTTDNTGVMSCDGFIGTSPTDGMNWGLQTFYWDPTNAAVGGYEVRVYDEQGNQVASQTVTGTTTTALDTGSSSRSGGVSYSWEVAALDANGNAVCTTPRITLQRGAQPPPPPSNDDDDDDEDTPEPEVTPEVTDEPPPKFVCEIPPEECYYGIHYEEDSCRCKRCEEVTEEC